MPNTISEGSTGEPVRDAQYLLARFQILSAPQVDGVFGPITDNAVRELFQQDQGLTVDGIVGPQTWIALFAVFSIPPTLSQGSSGTIVETLQQTLNNGRAEFDPGSPALATDGIFGPLTKAMVQAFQGWGGVAVDGIVGPQTWAVSLHAAGAVLASVVGV